MRHEIERALSGASDEGKEPMQRIDRETQGARDSLLPIEKCRDRNA